MQFIPFKTHSSSRTKPLALGHQHQTSRNFSIKKPLSKKASQPCCSIDGSTIAHTIWGVDHNHDSHAWGLQKIKTVYRKNMSNTYFHHGTNSWQLKNSFPLPHVPRTTTVLMELWQVVLVLFRTAKDRRRLEDG